jgi:hypothetical protein
MAAMTSRRGVRALHGTPDFPRATFFSSASEFVSLGEFGTHPYRAKLTMRATTGPPAVNPQRQKYSGVARVG